MSSRPLDSPPVAHHRSPASWAVAWAEGPSGAGLPDGRVPRERRAGVPLAALFARMQEAIVVVDLAFEVLVWSPGAERIFGWTAAETVGRPAWPFVAPDLPATAIATFRARALAEGQFQQVVSRRTKDGRAIRTELAVSLVEDDTGRPVALLAVSRDVTEREAEAVAREATLQRTREHERFLEALFAQMQDGVIVTGSDLCVQTWSAGAERLFGRSADEALGRAFYTSVCPSEPLPRLQTLVDEVRATGRGRLLTTTSGTPTLTVDLNVSLLRDTAGEGIGLLLVARDVTEREAWAQAQRALQAQLTAANTALLEAQRELLALATTDPLTGLATRRAVLEVAEREWRRARDHGSRFSCIMLDVDSFKQVNDRYGHLAGDAVLRHVGAVVRRSVRGSDVVGRYGGEEFLLVCPDATSAQAADVAEAVRAAVDATPCRAQGQSLRVTVSLGVATAKGPGTPVERLLAEADAALYEAKRGGRNRVVVARQEA